MHHAITDSEDPTTQIAWPSHRADDDAAGPGNGQQQDHTAPTPADAPKHARTAGQKGKKKLSTWNLMTLSIAMLGAQIAWTVELGYGTPFLLNLGVSEQITSLVWLAGPISGLVAQPVIGAISDSSTSKWRRRGWIIGATGVLVVTTLILAYCEAIAAFFVDLVGVGAGDWDERRNRQVTNVAIGFAVVAFYLLDFALNALQASLRNLLLDITPASQLNAGNAWHGRMTHAGNIFGFGIGFLPLAEFPLLRLLGGSQFRKFCVFCNVLLVITVAITCYCHTEEERPQTRKSSGKWREIMDNITTAVVNLPKPIRRVCYVQLFAFMGWFPFLFYATTYVGQVMAHEMGREPDADFATRKGELAMLFYSVVGVVSGTVLPHLANRDRRLLAHKDDVDEDAEITRLRTTVREWRAEAARKGRPMRLPVMPFLLRNIWTGAMIWFSILALSTFFVHTVFQATVYVALVGISWSVAMWAPFAIIMELLKEINNPASKPRPAHTRSISSSALPATARSNEREPLLSRRRSHDDFDAHGDDVEEEEVPVAGGTILGVHNLAIVMPQFVISLVAGIIFRVVDTEAEIPGEVGPKDVYFGKNGVAWVLRFGGLCTLVGAVLARRVAPTPTEKAMRRRLGEMRLLQASEGASP
ncbi:MFS general substrate transporter [Cylindrobasidium torrendii FP15055 ss-10]|uniref:MFS general substrate transporter n=1 Tax=Cylindrobasidium torrendii FP15055 ss-10 TaxID=1314674 RepID=A0A0D7BV11_9AGAR|nr:MFS general substrate transporter [Cylindrobasidium torrendii FP15055 ss-10]